jgi:serine/threonine protein kinase
MSTALPVASTEHAEVVGRYVLHAPVARGGMATVHVARLVGAKGFSRVVAAKRLHPQFTQDADFVAMFLDEAHIASRIHHPNVVPVLDVIHSGEELILVQEYVHGVPLDRLFKAANEHHEPIPISIAVGIAVGVLSGLHAAHETKDDRGQPLEVVHRDVSPPNIMVSLDGIPRLLDFGIAKARSSASITREGHFKGKIAYMSPEQLTGDVHRASDIYALGVVLWELLVGTRMHAGRSEEVTLGAVINGKVPTVTASILGGEAAAGAERWAQLEALEPLVMRSLALAVSDRYATAAEMRDALLRVAPCASPSELGDWVRRLGGTYLDNREQVLATTEASWREMQRDGTAASTDPSGVQPARRSGLLAPSDVTNPSLVTGPSQLTSASAIHAIGSSRFTPLILALLLVVTGVLATILVMVTMRKNERASADRASVATTTPAASVVAAPAHQAPIPTAAETTAPPATPPPSKPATGRSWQRSAPAGARPSPTTAPAPAIAPAPAKADCTPPFYYDGTKKVYKPECL